MGGFWGCCCTCVYFQDDFSTDQLSTAYDQRSGSWTVSSGVLTTTSAGALLRCETEGDGKGKVTVKGKLSSTAGSWRVVGSYVDDSNYLYLEFTYTGVGNNATVKMYERVAGVDTQIGQTATDSIAAGSFRTLTLCWDGRLAYGTNDSGSFGCLAYYTGAGTKAGVGASPGGTATFDDFKFEKHVTAMTTCPTCQCSFCQEGTMPAQVAIEFDNVANGNVCALCTCCTDLNAATIILDKRFDGASTCHYGAAYSCDIAGVYVTLVQIPTTGDIYVTVSFFGSPFAPEGSSLGDKDVVTVPVDCMYSPITQNMAPTNPIAPNHNCDWTAATVTITPVAP